MATGVALMGVTRGREMQNQVEIACMHCDFIFEVCVHNDKEWTKDTVFAVACPNCGRDTNFDGGALAEVDECDPTWPVARIAAP